MHNKKGVFIEDKYDDFLTTITLMINGDISTDHCELSERAQQRARVLLQRIIQSEVEKVVRDGLIKVGGNA